MKNTPCHPGLLRKILAPSGLVLLAALLLLAQSGPDRSTQIPTDPRWPPHVSTATSSLSDLPGWWEDLPTAVPVQTSTHPVRE